MGDCCYLCMIYILSVVCLGVRGILNRVHVDLVGSVRVSVRDSVKGDVGNLCGEVEGEAGREFIRFRHGGDKVGRT